MSSIFILMLHSLSFTQPVTQIIRGTITDEASKAPAPFATISILGLQFPKITTADSTGNFILPGVPVGRYDIEITLVGYQPAIIKEVMVSAGKEIVLSVNLKERTSSLSEVIVRAEPNKSKSLNNMATASARMFSVEEANRYAGGFDDYARLASSFAGVASNTGHNGIVIRGNAPRLIQWKMEGVEIPNPNHFADLSTFGGGGLTGLSSQLLDNSDFFTGAFPAEYGNALAGVFDMNMRKGNNEKHENTLQLGLIGIDAAMEGPFKKGKKSSYLFNYRYSTLGLLSRVLPEDADGTNYQDLSFKLHFPTRKLGTFSAWGIGLMDRSGAKAEVDSTKWVYMQDKEDQDVKQYMGAMGVSHRYFFNNRTYMKTTLAASLNNMDLITNRMDKSLKLRAQNKILNRTNNYTFSTYVNTKFNSIHTNKTGITVTGLHYNLLLKEANGNVLETIVEEKGNSILLNAYSSSSFRLSGKFQLNAGVNSQIFTLNKHYTIEPRLGLKYQLLPQHSLAFAYGLHSRLERLQYYFTKPSPASSDLHNKDLDFTKAHHWVLSYDWNVSSNMHIKVETYYQQLFSVPVIQDSSYSFINMENDWFLNRKLVNTGKGKNIGLDVTVEKYLSKGFYYLLSVSVFNSKYKGGDGTWRNTRFNRNYLLNGLAGKEWEVGRDDKNVLGINLRLSYQGGDHYTPVDLAASIAKQDVIFDGTRAFEKSVNPVLVSHFTLSYKKNKNNSSHEWALKLINTTNQKEFYGFRYNLMKRSVDKYREAFMVPNISYKIEF